MAGFRNSVTIRKTGRKNADGKPLWVVLEPLCYDSDIHKGVLCVPIGFETDLASVPRYPLVFWLTGDVAHEEAVLHDWLYVTRQLPRSKADAIFREAMATTGKSAWRRWIMWAGVRVGGGRFEPVEDYDHVQQP